MTRTSPLCFDCDKLGGARARGPVRVWQTDARATTSGLAGKIESDQYGLLNAFHRPRYERPTTTSKTGLRQRANLLTEYDRVGCQTALGSVDEYVGRIDSPTRAVAHARYRDDGAAHIVQGIAAEDDDGTKSSLL